MNATKATISGKITGGTGTLRVYNTGTLGAIDGSTQNATEITNYTGGTLSGKITGLAGNMTITNEGTISEDIQGGTGSLSITNSNTISGTSKKIVGGSGNLTIKNITATTANAPTAEIKNAIEASTGSTSTTTIENTGTINGTITGKDSKLNIINSGTLSAAITAAAGDVSITNNNGGNINTTITGAGGNLTITNAGNITQAINASTGGATKTTTINNTGTISGTITGKDSKLNIINSGTLSAAITAAAGDVSITNNNGGNINTTITGAGGNLTITNAGNITQAINASTGATKTTTINNTGNIQGAINGNTSALKIENFGSISNNIVGNSGNITIINNGSITGAITGGAGLLNITNNGNISTNITAGDNKLTLINSGNINSVVEVKNGNAITNYSNGSINEIKFGTASAVVDIANSGIIKSLNFTAASTAKLGQNYAVTLGSLSDYDTNGLLGITGTKSNATIQIASNNAFLLNMGSNVAVDTDYKLANFISGAGTNGAKLQNYDGTTTTLNGNHITTSQNIYDLNFYTSNNEILMRVTVAANKSMSSLGVIQSAASMNTQIVRTQSIIDGVFDSIATGEMGNVPYPRENYYGMSYKKEIKLAQLRTLENLEARSDVNNSTLDSMAMHNMRNKSWLGFVTPYFSTSSISPSGFNATNALSYGFIGGAAKNFSNGVLLGLHLAVESQASGKQGEQMRAQGASIMVGGYTKIPFAQFNMGALAIVPFVKVQLNGMVSFNSYSLTPIGDVTREANGLVGGFSGSVLAGVDMPTNFGYFTPELGLMQQFLAMPELSYLNFEQASNNQVIKPTNVTPLYLLAQLRYTKEIGIGNIGIYPTIKGGVRYALAGNSFTNTITLPDRVVNDTFRATTTLDSLVGIASAGVGVKIAGNASINLSYLGEFSATIQTHNINLGAGMQF
ncbi:hypothetical protein DCO58_00205 [Helicobacter saguini]|nr:hypothetical protein [Helicobacter saguini]MWV63185.1 hypothetical protein [Helicobacter saguini]MWV66145.1 hypothetical protein [Helicobacter saguini]MWV71951.1 hypothetical protein [Helicobacter saguini]TLD95959.1 hypothetical protein LS64_000945 [Helicobacter saguini]